MLVRRCFLFKKQRESESFFFFLFFFTALISQVKSVTVHAADIVLAWRGEINKDKEGREEKGTVEGGRGPMLQGRGGEEESGTTLASSHESRLDQPGRHRTRSAQILWKWV